MLRTTDPVRQAVAMPSPVTLTVGATQLIAAPTENSVLHIDPPNGGIQIAVSGGPRELSIIGTKPGRYTLTAIVPDAAGNSTVVTSEIIVSAVPGWVVTLLQLLAQWIASWFTGRVPGYVTVAAVGLGAGALVIHGCSGCPMPPPRPTTPTTPTPTTPQPTTPEPASVFVGPLPADVQSTIALLKKHPGANYVLVITDKDTPISESQLPILTSVDVRSVMNANGGESRFFDKTTDVTKEPAIWAQLMAQPASSYPWIIIQPKKQWYNK
jgi:hypothetical protein